jgi:hypothetical protein
MERGIDRFELLRKTVTFTLLKLSVFGLVFHLQCAMGEQIS